MNHIPDNGYETNNRKDDPKCIHGIGMYLRCARCADEANQVQAAGQAKPSIEKWFTKPEGNQGLDSSACAYCGNHVGHKPDCIYRSVSQAKPMHYDASEHGMVVEVPSLRDQLNERLCNELANLSRNVAGLTGVAQQLAEAVKPKNGLVHDRHGYSESIGSELGKATRERDKVEPKKAEGSNEGGLWSFSSDRLRNELWRMNGEVVPQPRDSADHLASVEGMDIPFELKRGSVYRVGEDGTVSQWTKMLGAVTEGEMYVAATIANVSIDKAEVLLTNFARSRGLMP